MCVDRFNSILVRLKVAKAMAEWRITDEFQFHTGSIKRSETSLKVMESILFQFHTGSIKSEWQYNGKLEVLTVSIPYWFD